jgi:hypothetical protein
VRRKPGLMRMTLEQLVVERDEMATEIRAHGGTPGVRPACDKANAALLRWSLYVDVVNEIRLRGEAS